MKQYYIYLTTNSINNMKYIGQHYGELDDNYLGSGTALKKAIKVFGKENFQKQILEICPSYSEANNAERKWIKKYGAVESPMFYNIASGGGNSNPLAGMSVEALDARREKLSHQNSGNKNYFYGKHLRGKDHPMYGKQHTKISKEKMRQAKVGGKAPTARAVAVYSPSGEYIRSFETQRELKIFLGLSPNGSTDTLKKYISLGKIYHGYIIKYI